jgi:hypothetical protein
MGLIEKKIEKMVDLPKLKDQNEIDGKVSRFY